MHFSIQCILASLVAHVVKNLLVMQKSPFDPGLKDPLEEDTATNSNILAQRIPWTEVPSGLQSMGLQRFGHD